MKDFIRLWLRNLWINALITAGVGLFMLLFMRIFYPGALPASALMWQAGLAFVNGFNLWPIIGLAVIVSAMPRGREWRNARDRKQN